MEENLSLDILMTSNLQILDIFSAVKSVCNNDDLQHDSHCVLIASSPSSQHVAAANSDASPRSPNVTIGTDREAFLF